MLKTKKLIALLCAISMIFTVFAGFSVVNAEETKGIALEYVADESTATEKTIVAKYVGCDNGVTAYNVTISIPEGATVVGTDKTGLMANDNLTATTYSIGGMGTAQVKSEGNVLAVIKITLSEANDAPFSVSLVEGTTLTEDTATISVKKGTLAVSTVDVPVWVDPDATPAPTPETPMATRAPKPTVDPDATIAPTKEPVVVEKGIALEYVADESTATEKTIVAKYVGCDNGVTAYNVTISIPEGATVVGTDKTGLMANDNLTATTYSIGGMGTAQVKSEGNVLAVIKITLSEANDAPFYVSLVDGATLTEDTATISVKKGTLPAAWVEVPVYGDVVDPTPAPKPVDSVTLPEVGITTEDVPADAAENDKLFIAVEVTKKDGSEAVYGVDYAATVGDKTLTEDEFNNVINGYFDLVDGVDSWEDVINNLKLDVYNEGTTVSAQLIQQTEEGDTVVAGGDKTVEPTSPPKPPVIKVTPASKTVKTGTKVTVSATVSNPVDGGVLTATVSEGALDLVTGSGIVIDEETQAVTFTGAVKGKIVITYTYTDAEGNALAKEAKSTITIQEKTESTGSGNGTSSDAGNDGPIANGNVNTGVTGTIPGMTKFNDLGDVAWAQEAITKLAAMGVVSGRDANTFDPNANITRAEYCQILVGAIGKAQEAADSKFDDVATDAWYYHSVSVASSYGIVSGYGDGNFGPNNLITRRDMALMTMKAAQVEGVNLSAIRTLTFADADQFEYAADAVNTLANAGIINGMSETEFAPLANATRAQAAKIIYDTFVK